MKKLLLLAGATLLMAACADSTTAPTRRSVAPSNKSSHDDFTCRSGYVVAYDANGNPYCTPDGTLSPTGTSTTSPTTTTTSPSTSKP